MENAEEVLQLLEEFSKMKPKDIPRELEDYLGYVAKTGDPVYQWTLIKHLFREKLVTVITDFYESTLTVELPPCPNVEPFNYERMKSSLLERFDTFSSAPFTVQRISELLTNPRKEYNRADKYMRAIEKNILVVSTREPGSGKRPLECDSQSETVLNGIPEIRSISDPGCLLHVPTDLPYLGAPPASNDVTVETTELTTSNDRLGQEAKTTDVSSLEPNNSKSWASQHSSPIAEESQENLPTAHSKIINPEVSLNACELDEGICTEDSNCDVRVDNNVVNDNESTPLKIGNLDSESSIDTFKHNCETVLPDSIDSSDSILQCKDERQNKTDNEEVGSVSDENEVSSTPGDVEDNPLIQEETDGPTHSEAEATESNLPVDAESDLSIVVDNEINSSDTMQTVESNPMTITDITHNKSNLVDLECNEITGTVDSPTSLDNVSQLSGEDIDQPVELKVGLDTEQSANQDSHPDSSNDVCLQEREIGTESQNHEPCVEADSVSEPITVQSNTVSNVSESILQCQTNDDIPNDKNNSAVSSPDLEQLVTKECLQDTLETPGHALTSSDGISEEQLSNPLSENKLAITEVQSSSEVTHEMCEQERRAVIQPIPNILPDSQHQIDEISVDTNCEAEESEAMDVDDCSNQMMISEGENEGEPMDQSDQLQS